MSMLFLANHDGRRAREDSHDGGPGGGERLADLGRDDPARLVISEGEAEGALVRWRGWNSVACRQLAVARFGLLGGEARDVESWSHRTSPFLAGLTRLLPCW